MGTNEFESPTVKEARTEESGGDTAVETKPEASKPWYETAIPGMTDVPRSVSVPTTADQGRQLDNIQQQITSDRPPEKADLSDKTIFTPPPADMNRENLFQWPRMSNAGESPQPGKFVIKGDDGKPQEVSGSFVYNKEQNRTEFVTVQNGKEVRYVGNDLDRSVDGVPAGSLRKLDASGNPGPEVPAAVKEFAGRSYVPNFDRPPANAGDTIANPTGGGRVERPTGGKTPGEVPVPVDTGHKPGDPAPTRPGAGDGRPVDAKPGDTAGTTTRPTADSPFAKPGDTSMPPADRARQDFMHLLELRKSDPDKALAFEREIRRNANGDAAYGGALTKENRQQYQSDFQKYQEEHRPTTDGRPTSTDKPGESPRDPGRGGTSDKPGDRPTGPTGTTPTGDKPGDKPGGTGGRPEIPLPIPTGGEPGRIPGRPTGEGDRPGTKPGEPGRVGPDGKPIQDGPKVPDGTKPAEPVRVGADGKPLPDATRVGADGKPVPDGTRVGADGKPVPDGTKPGADGKPQPDGTKPGADGKPQPDGTKPGADGKPGPDGKPQPGQDGKPQPGQDGKPGQDAAGAKPGQDAAQKVIPEAAQKAIERMAQLDFTDKRVRDTLSDVVTKMQQGKLDQLDERGRKLSEVLKYLEPEKLDRLGKLLAEGEKASVRGDRAAEAAVALNIKNLLEGKDIAGEKGRTSVAEGALGTPRTAAERLAEFMRTNKDILATGGDADKSRAAVLELGKIVKDLNRELGLDPTKGGLQVKDLVARSMEVAVAKGMMEAALGRTTEGGVRTGERLVEGKVLTGTQESVALTPKLTPAQETSLRTQLERLDGKTATVTEKGIEGKTVDGKAIDGKGILPTDRRPETTKLEAGTTTPQKTAAMDGRTTDDAGRLAGKQDGRTEVGVKGELAGKGEPGAKTEGGGKLDGTGKELGGKLDPTGKTGDAAAAAAAAMGAKGDGVMRDADGKILPGRSDSTEKGFEEDKKGKKEKQDKAEEEEAKRTSDAALALLAAKKAQEEKERAEKEREAAQEKEQKREQDKRQKYQVKEKDTLESIATKMLRDGKLAALILEINRNVIQVVEKQGKQVIDLRPKTIIWLPSQTDIKEFKGRMFSAAPTKFDYVQQPVGGGGGMTPEEELAARFGGTADDYRTDDGEKVASAGVETVEDLTAKAAEGMQTRRANVENLLGPLSDRKDDGGRIKYTVRLGDTLKSIAIKNPALLDVQLWKLLAEINDMDTSTDPKGNPKATLKRGSVIQIPSPADIEEYRQKNNLPGAQKAPARKAAVPTQFDIATKPCPGCQRMTTLGADICPACGFSFAAAAAAGVSTGPITEDLPITSGAPTDPILGADLPSPTAAAAPASSRKIVPPSQAAKGPQKPAEEEEDDLSRVVLSAAGFLGSEPAKAQSPPPPETPVPAAPEPATAVNQVLGPSTDEDDFTKSLFAGLGGFDFSTPAEPPPPPAPPVVPPAAPSGAPKAASALDARAVNNLVQQLSEYSRLVQSAGASGQDKGQKRWLEVQRGGSWVSIVAYEIYDDVSLRHEYNLEGKRKTIRIDLPPQAVQELADNDLNSNWQNYCERFLAGKSISD